MNAERVTPPADTGVLREEIIAACHKLQVLGYFIGTWGNIAVRCGEGLLITPSRVDYEELTPADIVAVDREGVPAPGPRLPSSELHIHRQILLARLDLGAVVHAHSPYASVLACAGRALPVCAEDMAQIIGAEVRCAPYVRGGDHRGLAAGAAQALGPTATAVLLANHGPVVTGRTLAEALVAAQVLEKAALMYVLAQDLGGARIIPPEAVALERDRYLYKYGTSADAVATGTEQTDAI
jgi:L-fuculose-phosphate aldolase